MKHTPTFAGTTLSQWVFICLMLLALVCRPLKAAPGQVFVRLPDHVPAALAFARHLGRLDAAARVDFALALPLRNQPQLEALLQRLYDPGDPLHGHFLTPDEFTAQFGPTQADYAAVAAYARAQGLTITATHPNRLLLDVTGPASAVESAFAIQLHEFQGADGRVFRAPLADPAVPLSIASRLAGVIGLDTAALRRPHRLRLDHARAAASTGTGPAGGLSPADIKAAYGLNGTAETGSGQTLAVFELDGYTASDVNTYESQFGLRQVPLSNVLVDGVTGHPSRGRDSGADEVTLDIEMQTALASGANQILVYEGPDTDSGVLDTYNRIATDDQAQEVSTCWGDPEDQLTSADLNTEHSIFAQMAAQGQAVFAAGGDQGAYDDGSTLSVDDPGSQPYVTSVGGTTLTTASAGGPWQSETTWNAGSVTNGAGGGGISSVWPIPSWQQGVISAASLGSTTMRNVPDVSLNADPNVGYAIYYNRSWQVYGGTSTAAPLWAAFTALANQRRSAADLSPTGFVNPSLYAIGQGADYGRDFHDIADDSNNLYYPAVSGFDDATGWGSFIGAGLLADLAAGSVAGTSPAPSPPAAPTGLTATGGRQQVVLSWNASSGATSYNVYRGTTAGGESPSPVATGVTSTGYTDTGLASGTTYYYTVAAVSAAGTGPAFTEASATTLPSAPAAPTNLAAVGGNAQVSLTWTASPTATGYSVERGTASGGPYAALASGLTGTTYTDGSVTNGVTYYYVVTATNSSGESGNSNESSATPTAPVTTSPTPASSSVTFPAGLNFLSLPFDETGVPLDTLFGYSGVTLYAWSPSAGQYSDASQAQRGQGYWVNLPSAVTVTGQNPAASAFSIPLTPGWNAIGDPFPHAVALDGVTVVSRGTTYTFIQAGSARLIGPALYRFDTASGAYAEVSPTAALEPGQGYWVYAAQSVTLVVPPD